MLLLCMGGKVLSVAWEDDMYTKGDCGERGPGFVYDI